MCRRFRSNGKHGLENENIVAYGVMTPPCKVAVRWWGLCESDCQNFKGAIANTLTSFKFPHRDDSSSSKVTNRQLDTEK